MGKTKKSKTPAGSQAGTSLTANPLAPDTFDMSDIVLKLNDTILALTRQMQKEQKAQGVKQQESQQLAAIITGVRQASR